MLDTIFNIQKTSSHTFIEGKNTNIQKTNKDLNPETKLSNTELNSVKDMVKVLNSLPDSELAFDFNEEGKMSVVKVFEKETERLIRQFPSEEFFHRLTYFRDNILPGLIMDEKV